VVNYPKIATISSWTFVENSLVNKEQFVRAREGSNLEINFCSPRAQVNVTQYIRDTSRRVDVSV